MPRKRGGASGWTSRRPRSTQAHGENSWRTTRSGTNGLRDVEVPPMSDKPMSDSEALCACRYHRDWTDDDRCVDCGRPIGDTVRLAPEDIARASERGRGLDDDRAIWG